MVRGTRRLDLVIRIRGIMNLCEEIRRLQEVRDHHMPEIYLTAKQVDDKTTLQYKIDALEAKLDEEIHNLAVILVRAFDKSGRMVIMVGRQQRDDTVEGFSYGCKNSEEINRGKVWSRAEELARVSIQHQ